MVDDQERTKNGKRKKRKEGMKKEEEGKDRRNRKGKEVKGLIIRKGDEK